MLLQFHVLYMYLNILKKLKTYFMILQKKCQKFIEHILAYLVIL